MDASAELFIQVDNMYMEVEMPTKDLADFSWKYNMTGCGILPRDFVLLRDTQHSNCCRIYFNCDESLVNQLKMFGYKVTDRDSDMSRGHWRNEYRWRLDSNTLFWKLCRNGFRLGYWPVSQSMAA
jgi:hypothetical protein